MKDHYSFDLWFTLIRSNPIFKSKRAEYFFRHFNTSKKSIEEVSAVIREVDLLCNAMNEKTGGNISAEEMYLMVIHGINQSLTYFQGLDMQAILQDMDTLFLTYHPVLFDEDTRTVLEKLRERERTMNILSNTAFVKGKVLRTLLKDILLIEPFFNFQIYSDEVNFSKPSSHIFDILHAEVERINQTKVDRGAILHIGDNWQADCLGAVQAGMEALQINTNHHTIKNILPA